MIMEPYVKWPQIYRLNQDTLENEKDAINNYWDNKHKLGLS